jgi:hypothetical protein
MTGDRRCHDRASPTSQTTSTCTCSRGYGYCALEEYRDAEATYSNGISVDPTFTLAYLMRGTPEAARFLRASQDLRKYEQRGSTNFAPLVEADTDRSKSAAATS